MDTRELKTVLEGKRPRILVVNKTPAYILFAGRYHQVLEKVIEQGETVDEDKGVFFDGNDVEREPQSPVVVRDWNAYSRLIEEAVLDISCPVITESAEKAILALSREKFDIALVSTHIDPLGEEARKILDAEAMEPVDSPAETVLRYIAKRNMISGILGLPKTDIYPLCLLKEIEQRPSYLDELRPETHAGMRMPFSRDELRGDIKTMIAQRIRASLERPERGDLVVVCGPTGVGKTSTIHGFERKSEEDRKVAQIHTTRGFRSKDEETLEEYVPKTLEEFMADVREGNIVVPYPYDNSLYAWDPKQIAEIIRGTEEHHPRTAITAMAGWEIVQPFLHTFGELVIPILEFAPPEDTDIYLGRRAARSEEERERRVQRYPEDYKTIFENRENIHHLVFNSAVRNLPETEGLEVPDVELTYSIEHIQAIVEMHQCLGPITRYSTYQEVYGDYITHVIRQVAEGEGGSVGGMEDLKARVQGGEEVRLKFDPKVIERYGERFSRPPHPAAVDKKILDVHGPISGRYIVVLGGYQIPAEEELSDKRSVFDLLSMVAGHTIARIDADNSKEYSRFLKRTGLVKDIPEVEPGIYFGRYDTTFPGDGAYGILFVFGKKEYEPGIQVEGLKDIKKFLEKCEYRPSSRRDPLLFLRVMYDINERKQLGLDIPMKA